MTYLRSRGQAIPSKWCHNPACHDMIAVMNDLPNADRIVASCEIAWDGLLFDFLVWCYQATSSLENVRGFHVGRRVVEGTCFAPPGPAEYGQRCSGLTNSRSES